MDRLFSFVMVLLIGLVASPSVKSAKAQSFLNLPSSGYCAKARPGRPINYTWARNVSRCPENQRSGTVRQKTPKSTPVKKAKTTVAVAVGPRTVDRKRELFAGNESRLGWFYRSDCSSKPLPDVRISTQPSKGVIRVEPVKVPLNENAPVQCNSKPTIDAVAVFYKSASDSIGSDKMTVEVDFRNGNVTRYVYEIEIR